MTEKLFDAIISLSRDEALKVTDELLLSKTKPENILDVGREAMQIIGERFETGEYFLPELIVSGDIIAAIANKVKPYLDSRKKTNKGGKVVLGTVAGDIHDIAKDIVAFILDINGFDVIDLGVDVPVGKFVDAVQEHQAKIVGLSGFLTLAIETMRETISALKGAGFTDVKVMIGGGPINELVCNDIGADDWGANAMDAVSIASKWAGVNQ
jgi:methanogenic corrinoid protein MtbC1